VRVADDVGKGVAAGSVDSIQIVDRHHDDFRRELRQGLVESPEQCFLSCATPARDRLFVVVVRSIPIEYFQKSIADRLWQRAALSGLDRVQVQHH